MSLLDTAHSHAGNSAGAPSRANRRWSRRLSKGHWVALVVGLLAALINIAVLRDRREMTAVAVARVTVPLVPWAASSGGGQPSGSAYSAYVGRPPNCQSWTSTSAYSPARA